MPEHQCSLPEHECSLPEHQCSLPEQKRSVAGLNGLLAKPYCPLTGRGERLAESNAVLLGPEGQEGSNIESSPSTLTDIEIAKSQAKFIFTNLSTFCRFKAR